MKQITSILRLSKKTTKLKQNWFDQTEKFLYQVKHTSLTLASKDTDKNSHTNKMKESHTLLEKLDVTSLVAVPTDKTISY